MTKTPKSIALGGAIRQARQAHGETLRDFAGRMGVDPAMMSRWETGARSPQPENVARMLTALGVTGERYKGLMTLAYGTGQDQWVATSLPEQQQQMFAFVSCEQQATRLVEFSPLLIPGLLQTTDYTRAIMSAPGVPPAEIEDRVRLRADRKEVILRPHPAHLTAIIGEGALYQGIGGAAVTEGQLRYLLAIGRRANVELRIVPNGTGWHPGLEGPFHLIEGVNLITSVFVETRRSTLWLHKEADVRAYKQAVELILRHALSPGDSMRFVAHQVRRMETRRDLPDHVAQGHP
ncbi:helix-turn-helix transcriptional regulator [Actinokineospora sp. UTMC 2448]|uniref:helix-turn-helix domain-containing protein n=1 Tax=Actinokineospora sp. UTMC 2448 TaxID=2268449 RepID=UPI0021642887|nr:helix-turn-helix transcriptional regulator [Actinokineospora sp. UTMC 2448]UVS82395.1 Helix-turn-helix domain protein [Actinokineospora sp. UTMC 2448]